MTKQERHLLIGQLANRMTMCANRWQLQESYREAMFNQLSFSTDEQLQKLDRDIPQVSNSD